MPNEKPYQDKEVLESLYPAHSQKEVAEILGVSVWTINKWIHKLGIEVPSSNGRVRGDAEKAADLGVSCEQLRQDYDQLGTHKKLARKHHTSGTVIRYMMGKCSIANKPTGPKPQSGDLRYRDLDWLQSQVDLGLSQAQIADKVGVHSDTLTRWMAKLERREPRTRYVVHSKGNGYPFWSGAEVTKKLAESQGPEGMRLLSDGRCYEVRGGEIVRTRDFRRIIRNVH